MSGEMADEALQALRRRMDELEQRVGRAEDVESIRKLQYQYGYYLDKCFYEEVVDLFSDDEPVVHFLRGIWKGKEGVRRLYLGRLAGRFAEGKNGPLYGHLLDHPQMQGVVDVAEDRLSAKARFRTIMMAGTHETIDARRSYDQWWESGLYENEYVREGGRWLIKVLNFRQFVMAPYEKGWRGSVVDYPGYVTTPYPQDPTGPDEMGEKWSLWPDTTTFPFHYDHPVTGEKVPRAEERPG